MQAKKIIGCRSRLGLVAQAALKAIASQQDDDDDEEELDEEDKKSLEEQKKAKYANPANLVMQVKSPSVDNEQAYKLIMDWLNNAPHHNWSNKSDETPRIIQNAIREAIKAAVVEANRIEYRFLRLFHDYMGQDMKNWIMSIDLHLVTFDKLRLIGLVLARPSDFVIIGVQPPLTRQETDDLLERIANVLMDNLFSPQRARARSRRRPRRNDMYNISGSVVLSPGYFLHKDIPCMPYNIVIQRGNQVFIAPNRIGRVTEFLNSFRNAIAAALEENPSIGLLFRYFSLKNFEFEKKLYQTPMQELYNLLKSVPDTKNATIGDVMPEGEKEVRAVLDEAISKGKMIWEEPSQQQAEPK